MIAGDQGATGERGDTGDRGVQGERGMKGDHGQHGGDGEKGDIGETGERGPIGKTGPTAPYLGRTQTLTIFAFVVLAFVLLAYRSEINARHISTNTARIKATQDLTCMSTREVQVKFNREQDALIAIERQNIALDPNLRAARIKVYKEAKIEPLPICDHLGSNP